MAQGKVPAFALLAACKWRFLLVALLALAGGLRHQSSQPRSQFSLLFRILLWLDRRAPGKANMMIAPVLPSLWERSYFGLLTIQLTSPSTLGRPELSCGV